MRITLTSCAVAAALLAATHANAQNAPAKVRLMPSATGTYANLTSMIENGFKLYVAEQGGKPAGRDIVYAKVDDELLIVPNDGTNAITGPMCAKNFFASSFSSGQSGYSMGNVAAERGHKKVVTITWNYAFGNESIAAFTEDFEKGDGKITQGLSRPFPNVEFQVLLIQVAAGWSKSAPLYGPGFMADGTLEAQGQDARGMLTTLHYAGNLNTPRDNAFRQGVMKAYSFDADADVMSAAHNPVQHQVWHM